MERLDDALEAQRTDRDPVPDPRRVAGSREREAAESDPAPSRSFASDPLDARSRVGAHRSDFAGRHQPRRAPLGVRRDVRRAPLELIDHRSISRFASRRRSSIF